MKDLIAKIVDGSIMGPFTRNETIVRQGEMGLGPAPDNMKAYVHKTLLRTFEDLYAMKALTRFSVALLGCPVEGIASNVVERFAVGEVKVLVFPAGEPVDLRVAAHAPGAFTLDIFSPGRRTAAHFGPVPITPGNDVVASWGRRR